MYRWWSYCLRPAHCPTACGAQTHRHSHLSESATVFSCWIHHLQRLLISTLKCYMIIYVRLCNRILYVCCAVCTIFTACIVCCNRCWRNQQPLHEGLTDLIPYPLSLIKQNTKIVCLCSSASGRWRWMCCKTT